MVPEDPNEGFGAAIAAVVVMVVSFLGIAFLIYWWWS